MSPLTLRFFFLIGIDLFPFFQFCSASYLFPFFQFQVLSFLCLVGRPPKVDMASGWE
jgi:hypothetical protein